MHFESPVLSPEVLIPLLLTAAVFDDRDFALLTALGVEWPNGNVAFTRGIQAARLLLWPQPASAVSAVTSGVEPDAAPARNDVAPAAAVDDDTASSIDESESAAAVPDARKVEPPPTTTLFVGHVPYGLAALVVMLLVQITGCPILRSGPLPNTGRRKDPTSSIIITVNRSDQDKFLQLHRRCMGSKRGLYVMPPCMVFDVTDRDDLIKKAHQEMGRPSKRKQPQGMQPLNIELRQKGKSRQRPQREPATPQPSIGPALQPWSSVPQPRLDPVAAALNFGSAPQTSAGPAFATASQAFQCGAAHLRQNKPYTPPTPVDPAAAWTSQAFNGPAAPTPLDPASATTLQAFQGGAAHLRRNDPYRP